MRAFGALWALTLCGIVAPSARPVAAQPAPRPYTLTASDVPDVNKRPLTVAVLPIKSYLVAASAVFAPELSPATDATSAQVDAAVASALREMPYVDPLPAPAVRAALATGSDVAARTAAAQQFYRHGLELYLGLATGRAVEKLAQATRVYADVFAEVFEPKASADAQFMLGVALVDAGRAAEGHVAIKAGFAHQPDRRFRRDFFAPAAAAAIAAALTDFLSTADPSRPYGDNARMAAIARKLGVDWLVLSTLRRGDHGPELFVAVFSAQKRLIEAEAHFALAELPVRLEPFITRWLACVPIAHQGVSAPSTQTVWPDMSLAWALFLKQPTRRDFQSLGFAGGTDIVIRQNLHWYGRLGLHTSLPDPYRDLLRSFNSLRVTTGLGAVGRSGPLRIFANLGLDAHLLGNFVTSIDPNCKLFGVNHRLCDKTSVLNLDERVLFGINGGIGGQLHVGRDFVMAVRVSISNYFLPLSGAEALNRPLGVEFGFGYRL